MEGKNPVISDMLVDCIIHEPKYIDRRINLRELTLSEKRDHLVKKVKVECDAYDCHLLIRQCVDRPCNFSVILVYSDINKNDHVVLRLNGNHGRHRNRIEVM